LTNNGTTSTSPNILVRVNNGVRNDLDPGGVGPNVNITGRNWLRLQVYNDDDNNVVLKSMWWPVGAAMPMSGSEPAWEIQYIDTDAQKITTGGNVGLAGWKVNTLWFDNFQVYGHQ
jgi:hypothetical protein